MSGLATRVHSLSEALWRLRATSASRRSYFAMFFRDPAITSAIELYIIGGSGPWNLFTSSPVNGGAPGLMAHPAPGPRVPVCAFRWPPNVRLSPAPGSINTAGITADASSAIGHSRAGESGLAVVRADWGRGHKHLLYPKWLYVMGNETSCLQCWWTARMEDCRGCESITEAAPQLRR